MSNANLLLAVKMVAVLMLGVGLVGYSVGQVGVIDITAVSVVSIWAVAALTSWNISQEHQ